MLERYVVYVYWAMLAIPVFHTAAYLRFRNVWPREKLQNGRMGILAEFPMWASVGLYFASKGMVDTGPVVIIAAVGLAAAWALIYVLYPLRPETPAEPRKKKN